MIAEKCCGSCEHWGGNINEEHFAKYYRCDKVNDATARNDYCDDKNYSPHNPIKSPHEKMWEELPFIIGQITDEEIYNIPLFSGHGTLDLKNLIIDKIKKLEEKYK